PCASVNLIVVFSLAFFFQAEDGIRDFHVTGVQTCALPISFADVEVHSFAVLERTDSADALWERCTRAMTPIVMMKQSLGDRFQKIGRASCRERVEMSGVT